MAVGDAIRQEDAVLAARRFLDAFNERDVEAMQALVTDDVELHTWPADGCGTGSARARDLLDTASELQLRLIPLQRGEHAEERDGEVLVELRVRELIGYDDIERIADFVIRDGTSHSSRCPRFRSSPSATLVRYVSPECNAATAPAPTASKGDRPG